jgi:hypothetical protein
VIITLELAKELLQYSRVVQRRYHQPESGTTYEIFSAIPDQGTERSVDLYFNDQCDTVDMVSFGRWHAHYDSAEDEGDNIRNAFNTARGLVLRERCLIEELGLDGRSLGECVVAPEELPETLSLQARSLRRVMFGRAPREEAIDFSLYHRGQYLWISLARKAEIERLYREHDMPFPDL